MGRSMEHGAVRARVTPEALVLDTAGTRKPINNHLVQFVLEDTELLIGEGNLIHKVHLAGQHGAIYTSLQLPILVEDEVFIHLVGLLFWRAGFLCRGRQESEVPLTPAVTQWPQFTH